MYLFIYIYIYIYMYIQYTACVRLEKQSGVVREAGDSWHQGDPIQGPWNPSKLFF